MHVFALLLLYCVCLASSKSTSNNHDNCHDGWSNDKLFGRKIVILGDSNAHRLTVESDLIFKKMSSFNKVGKPSVTRCGLCSYMAVDCTEKQWFIPPKMMGIGPALFGLQFPFCSDCSSCFATKRYYYKKIAQNNNSILRKLSMEYLPVEYAKDYTIQTLAMNTTQENVVKYLNKSNHGPGDYVIFNTGLHDIPHATPEQYRHNLQSYATMVSSVGASIIWVKTGHPCLRRLPPEFRSAYSRETVNHFNEIADKVLAGVPNYVGSIDTAANSVVGNEFNDNEYFVDGHHMKPVHYFSIMMQALHIICSLNSTVEVNR
jgi:hypothetical protein